MASIFGSVSYGVTAPSPWIVVHVRFCTLQEWSLFPPVLYKSNNQMLLIFKVRFPWLGSLMWGSEPSQQWKNYFGIIVTQFVGRSPSEHVILFYRDCAPSTILLWLLCVWMQGIFFWWVLGSFHWWSFNSYLGFGALSGGDECMSFYSTILKWKSSK